MHNIYINNTLYIVSTSACFVESASSSGSLNVVKVKQSRYRPGVAGPEGSRKLRFPDFMTTAQKGGKVVSLTHRPHLPPGNPPGTHLC